VLALAEGEPRYSSPLPLAAIPSPVSVSWPRTGYGNKSFTAREWDSETGLYYFRARYLDPKLGRFISEGPIGFEGGENFYAHVLNNPINYSDPLGLAAEVCCRLLREVGWFIRLRHCYIRVDGETYGLYPEGGFGFPRKNDPRDTGGKCAPCPSMNCDQKGCFEKAHQNYPVGSYSPLGPNSNTYAATLANSCCQGGMPPGTGWHWGSGATPPAPWGATTHTRVR
jgi:RHS repeat-associated protein